jgi:hypothetical protein
MEGLDASFFREGVKGQINGFERESGKELAGANFCPRKSSGS